MIGRRRRRIKIELPVCHSEVELSAALTAEFNSRLQRFKGLKVSRRLKRRMIGVVEQFKRDLREWENSGA